MLQTIKRDIIIRFFILSSFKLFRATDKAEVLQSAWSFQDIIAAKQVDNQAPELSRYKMNKEYTSDL